MPFYQTTLVTSRPQLIVNPGDGHVLVFNNDQNNTIYIGEQLGDFGGGGNTAQLPPLGMVVFDGSLPVYLCTIGNQTAQIFVIPGGVNFFQLAEIITKTLIISASKGNGEFVYNPSPALGNLIASITAVNGTDQFGDTTVAGIVAYSGSSYVQLLNAAVNISEHVSGAFWSIAVLSNGLMTISDVSGDPVLIKVNAGDPASPGTAESWHTASTPGFSTNGTHLALKYTLQSDGMVELQGEIAATAAYTAGTTIFTLPSAYRPNQDTNLSVTYVTAGGNLAGFLAVPASGAVNFSNNLAIGNVVIINVRFRLVL